MIRKLTEKDNEKGMALILPQASINLFIIGDIEMYGYDVDFQELWGDFDDQDNLCGILLRYYNDFIVYGLEGYDAEGFVRVIESHENHGVISGEQAVLKVIQPILKGEYENKELYFAECRKETLNLSENEALRAKVECAKPEDAKKIAELACSIEEFTIKNVDEQAERIAKKIKDKAGRDYFIKEGGKIVSTVSTAAENSKSAMLVGVCTAPTYRMKGYTTAIMSEILQDLFEEKESVCLFYDNPKAGRIYKRSGFVDIGMWTMLVRKKS